MKKAYLAAGGTALDWWSEAAMRTFPGGAKRRGPRLSIQLPGVIFWCEGEAEQSESVRTTSIGRFGCAIQSSTFLQPGTQVRLDFGRGTMEGHVVHSLKDYSVNLVTVGVAFEREARDLWPVGLDL